MSKTVPADWSQVFSKTFSRKQARRAAQRNVRDQRQDERELTERYRATRTHPEPENEGAYRP